jgi:hypothetical protein
MRVFDSLNFQEKDEILLTQRAIQIHINNEETYLASISENRHC